MLSDKQKKHILVNRDGLKYYTVEGLEKVHEEMLRLLLIIDTIAKENNIPYWIDGGSLIGIVRHKGFIPWDDDLDISLLKKDYLRLIKEIKPRAVMLENVRGFLDNGFSEYRQYILKSIEKLGYDTQIKLLNASDFGVPQLRPRVVIVGIRREENRNFTYPQGDSQIAPTVGNTLYDLMAENKWKGAKKWAQNANKIAPTLVGGSKKHGGPDLGPVRARNAWAELGVDGRGVANMAPEPDFEGMPRLTSRMLARIQGFPDTWTFGKKKTAACRMIGNAFPPPVAKAVGEKIKECLEDECIDCERAVSLSRKIV